MGNGTTSAVAAELLKTAGALVKGISYGINLLARKQHIIPGRDCLINAAKTLMPPKSIEYMVSLPIW